MGAARRTVRVGDASDKDWGRAAVAASGLSLSALAKRCGIPKKRLYAATHGGDPFTADECSALSEALGVPRDRCTFCGEQLADALARETMLSRPANAYICVSVRRACGSDVAVGWVLKVFEGEGVEREVVCGDVRSRDAEERVMTLSHAEAAMRAAHGIL